MLKISCVMKAEEKKNKGGIGIPDQRMSSYLLVNSTGFFHYDTVK